MKGITNFDLETPLLRFKGRKTTTAFTVRDACAGTICFGGLGSGKTTTTGATLLRKVMSLGFGGLILTVKTDEIDLIKKYAKETGRLDDLIIVEPESDKYVFDFVQYEAQHRPAGISISENLVTVLKQIINAREDKDGGKHDDMFWSDSLDMLLVNTFELCMMAYNKVSLQLMYDIVLTAPKKGQTISETSKPYTYAHAFRLAQQNINDQITSHEKLKHIEDADELERLALELLPDARTFKSIDDYFIESFRNLSEKTRTIIEHIFLGFVFKLLKEPARSLMSAGKITFKPEDCLDNKIIVLNIPVKKFDKVGRDMQTLFKYVWQRWAERRNLAECDLPLFLFADESQHFLTEHDSTFQATARSNRIITVYLTQNIPNYLAAMGGAKSQDRVMGLIGTMANKFFHCNSDAQTNKYGSDLIGQGFTEDRSNTDTISGDSQFSETSSFKLDDMMRPNEFSYLRTGGPENDYLVDAIIHMQGKKFDNGFNFKKVTYRQQF